LILNRKPRIYVVTAITRPCACAPVFYSPIRNRIYFTVDPYTIPKKDYEIIMREELYHARRHRLPLILLKILMVTNYLLYLVVAPFFLLYLEYDALNYLWFKQPLSFIRFVKLFFLCLRMCKEGDEGCREVE